jgi:hypothetical protein
MNEVLPAIKNKIDRVFIGLQNAQAQALIELDQASFEQMSKSKGLWSQQKTVDFLKGYSFKLAMGIEHLLWIVWGRG